MTNQIGIQEIVNYVRKYGLYDKLQKILEKFDFSLFNKSFYHGLNHSVNVSILSGIIASTLNLNSKDIEILMYASILHDIGRVSDDGDYNHALNGSIIASSLLEDINFNLSYEEIRVVCFLVEGHNGSMNDLSLFEKYNIDQNRGKKLLSILKDADILDRVRFIKNKENIDLSKINFGISLTLSDFARYINSGIDFNTVFGNGIMSYAKY